MTVGQRIAQRRRELGLSQEALGERLGVSRQAIYKWESDAALPEIEKLVNLSREFSVSIDWLLGVEDGAREGQGKEELTPEQLRMVEEIVGRYLDARPQPEFQPPPGPEEESETGSAGVRWLKRWGLSWLALGAVVVMALVIFNLFDRLDSVRRDYQSVLNSVNYIRDDVNRQIYGITNRVEEVLQSQNSLTVEQSAQVSSADYRANTVTVAVRALPRTYVEGMTAEFLMDSGGETIAVPGALGEDHAFTADVTGPLTDDVSLSVVFLSGDQRETQLLGRFSYLYTSSFPGFLPVGNLWRGQGNRIDEYTWFDPEPRFDENGAGIEGIRMGLFRDRELLAWYESTEKPDNYYGDSFDRSRFFRLEGEWTMEPGHMYEQVAIITDEYGRERAYPSDAMRYNAETRRVEWCGDSGLENTLFGYDPSIWTY